MYVPRLPLLNLVIVLRDQRRRSDERGHRGGQRKNTTNMHHLSPDQETPTDREPWKNQGSIMRDGVTIREAPTASPVKASLARVP